ncbi:MAG: DUF2807 domain-containing protein [Alistipes sp.]|nr:DUF2807 domain-containing protein [Alistipes sp.]
MKKIFFMVLSAVCFMATAQAQKVVIISDEDKSTIEYTETELRHSELKELISTLPTTVIVTAEDSDIISIAAPASVFPYLKFDFRDESLAIACDNDAPNKVMSTLNQNCHIKVTIPSESLRNITNTSDMNLFFENGKCANKLLITNTLTMGIISDEITAESNIEIYNTGTMTLKVDNINTEQLFTLNTGYLYMRGATTANSILQNSSGIENSLLNVNCQKLEILSTGEGIIEFHGIADDVTVANMGKATIKTSKLNNFE